MQVNLTATERRLIAEALEGWDGNEESPDLFERHEELCDAIWVSIGASRDENFRWVVIDDSAGTVAPDGWWYLFHKDQRRWLAVAPGGRTWDLARLVEERLLFPEAVRRRMSGLGGGR